MTTSRHSAERHSDAGITLIEMLVSLVIFAFVGLASFTMLDTLLNVQDRTEGRLETLAQLDRALTVFSHDFVQGDPAKVVLEDDVMSVLFAPDQRHSYALIDGVLSRTIAAELGGSGAFTQTLATEIRETTFTVLDTANVWQSVWPPEDVTAAPRAVRLVLTLGENRTITRLVALTDAALP